MKIPKQIKIGGFMFNVKESKQIAIEGNGYGSTHHTTQTIYIDPDSTPQKKEQTFLHEMMHGIWNQVGLNKREYTHKQEEEIIDALSHGLYQVLKDNKLLK